MARRPDANTKRIGHVNVRWDARRNRWRVRWIDSVGHNNERLALTEAEADQIASMILIAESTPGAALQPDITWGALRTSYLDPNNHSGWRSPATGEKALAVSRVHLSSIDNRKCSTLTTADFNNLLQKMADAGYAASTIRTAWETLRAIVRWGSARGVWNAWSDPLNGVGIPRNVKKTSMVELIDRTSEVPTAAQVDDLAAAIATIDPKWGLLVRFAAGSGLRMGELVGLTPGDIDLDSREISVVRQVREVRGKQNVALPKHEKTRIAMFHASLDADLREYLDGRDPKLPIWPARGNRYLRRSTYGRIFRDARDGSIYPDHMAMHSLRHFWVCSTLDGGTRLPTVSKLAGHATVTFTMDRYVGADDDYLDEARAKMV